MAAEKSGCEGEISDAHPSINHIQLKISLKGSKPPIWRRVIVSDQLSLHNLHEVIQATMGWFNEHLHGFTVAERPYWPVEFMDDWMLDEPDLYMDTDSVTLGSLRLTVKRKLLYVYDLGDNWTHEILVEKIFPVSSNAALAKCVGGRRSCPPEDCGGMHSYNRLVFAQATEANKELIDKADLILGPDFDPASFDITSVNKQLQRLCESWNLSSLGSKIIEQLNPAPSLLV